MLVPIPAGYVRDAAPGELRWETSRKASPLSLGRGSLVAEVGVEMDTEVGRFGQEIGPEQRERLRRGRVLIVGIGGLGSPVALHLASAGIGTLGLADFDTVDLSNLHRQIIYRTPDIGRLKAVVAAERLRVAHPEVSVECFQERLSPANLADIFPQYDFIIDGTDRMASKYLINDGAVLCGVPFSHAGVSEFHGQTMTVVPHRSACFRCLFPTPPPEGEIPTCQEAGIIGALAGSIGLLQALEALKHILQIGALLTNRMLIYDALQGHWRAVQLSRNRNCPLCGEQPRIRHVASIESANEEYT
jgi:molybdopterin/thiamine biosynthesis adenylyltransferase